MRFSFFCRGLAAAGLMLSSAAFAAGGLDVNLSSDLGKRSSEGLLRYSITNDTDMDLLVLSWETPLKGIEGDLFEVYHNGKQARYVGREYKRGLPQAEDYIEIKAHQTLSVDLDLSGAYEMRQAGIYKVQFVGHFHDSFAVKPASGNADEKLLPLSEMDLRSPVADLWVDGVSLPMPTEPTGMLNISKAGSVSFVGCTNSQASGASAGHSAAQAMADDALAYLNAGLRGSRYTTWFGSYSSSTYATLTDNFLAIDDALDNRPIEFYCDCTSSAFAYVYPTQPYKIHLCNAYWQAGTTGTDSKGGTVIHETSHFDVVAGTDDVAYGQTACKRLAKRPKRAIKNADSHEYFAENTPKLN